MAVHPFLLPFLKYLIPLHNHTQPSLQSHPDVFQCQTSDPGALFLQNAPLYHVFLLLVKSFLPDHPHNVPEQTIYQLHDRNEMPPILHFFPLLYFPGTSLPSVSPFSIPFLINCNIRSHCSVRYKYPIRASNPVALR